MITIEQANVSSDPMIQMITDMPEDQNIQIFICSGTWNIVEGRDGRHEEEQEEETWTPRHQSEVSFSAPI